MIEHTIGRAVYEEWEQYKRDNEIDEPTQEDKRDFLIKIVDKINETLEQDCGITEYVVNFELDDLPF